VRTRRMSCVCVQLLDAPFCATFFYSLFHTLSLLPLLPFFLPLSFLHPPRQSSTNRLRRKSHPRKEETPTQPTHIPRPKPPKPVRSKTKKRNGPFIHLQKKNRAQATIMPVSHSSTSTAGPSSKVAFATNLTTTIPSPLTPSSPNPSISSNQSHIGHKKRSSGSEVFVAENSHMKRSISTPAMASASMISSDQIANFERQRQGQIMMTTYISSAIRDKKQVRLAPFPFSLALFSLTPP
jgi:hypothetical protein